MLRFAGKTALVTGGSRGIGAGIALRLASEGADVAITFAGNAQAADRTVEQIRSLGRRGEALKADASDASAVRAAVDTAASQLGGLDILVHSAGLAEYASITDATDERYLDLARRHFAINVEGVIATTKAALRHLRDGGRILIIGSVNAHQMPFPGIGIYGGSKAAVAGLAQGWARDLGSRGILVNVIQPGPIDTEMNPNDDRAEVKVMTAMTALKRYGHVTEVAALAAFLASDEASYITGTAIDIDGGFSL